jgi:hypothetical protein
MRIDHTRTQFERNAFIRAVIHADTDAVADSGRRHTDAGAAEYGHNGWFRGHGNQP